MLSQGAAAWVDFLRRGCDRREQELSICMYPCSLNWFLENKFEITCNVLVSLGTKHGGSLFASGLGLPFQIPSLSQQSLSSQGGDGNFVYRSHPENSSR